MFNTTTRYTNFKKLLALLVSLALLLGCTGLTCTGCTSATSSSPESSAQSTEVSTDAIAAQFLAIEGVTGVTEYTNEKIVEAGFDQVYTTFEITFEQPLDHNNASAGTFEQHVRLFYTESSAVNVINTDGYMLTDLSLIHI